MAAGGRRAFIWDIQTSKLRGRFTEHTGQIDTVDFSPAGDQVLSGAQDGTSRIWDALTRQQIRSFPSATGQTNPAVWSPDASRVFAGSGLNLPCLWDALTGEELRTFPGHSGAVKTVAMSSDGTKAITGSSDKTAIVWNTKTADRLLTFSRHISAINSVAFSRDGTQALTASDDLAIRVWDAVSGSQAAVFIQSNQVLSAVLSPDAKYVVSCGLPTAGVAYLWEVSSGALVRTFSQGDQTRISGVSMSPDRTLIATSHSDGRVRLWQSGLEAIPLHPITPLAVGSELPLSLRSLGLDYFEIDIEAGRNLLIALGAGGQAPQTTDPAVRIFVRRGGLPSLYDYDYFAQAPVSDLRAEIPIAATTGGKYFVLISSPYVPEGSVDTTIRADYVGFHITSISPNSGGNTGSTTTQIRGTGFTADTIAKLVAAGGGQIPSEPPTLVNPGEVFVTFNLTGAALGRYDVQIEKSGQAPISLQNALEVTGGIGGRLETRLVTPTAVRPQRYSTVWLEYANVGARIESSRTIRRVL